MLAEWHTLIALVSQVVLGVILLWWGLRRLEVKASGEFAPGSSNKPYKRDVILGIGQLVLGLALIMFAYLG